MRASHDSDAVQFARSTLLFQSSENGQCSKICVLHPPEAPAGCTALGTLVRASCCAHPGRLRYRLVPFGGRRFGPLLIGGLMGFLVSSFLKSLKVGLVGLGGGPFWICGFGKPAPRSGGVSYFYNFFKKFWKRPS